jgi:hypothetical protein
MGLPTGLPISSEDWERTPLLIQVVVILLWDNTPAQFVSSAKVMVTDRIVAEIVQLLS